MSSWRVQGQLLLWLTDADRQTDMAFIENERYTHSQLSI